MKKKLLITGASGFLGYHLIEAALSEEYEVIAGVRASSNINHLDNNRVKVLPLNLSDIASTRAALAANDINYIIHAAALTKAKQQKDYDFANATLTRNLAEAAGPNLNKFVFISSLAALGPSHDGKPIAEDNLPQPVTFYGRSKMLAESYLRTMPNLPFIVFRPTAVYGPREKDLLVVVKSVLKGWETYIGGNEQQLSFVYAKDMAALAVKALSANVSGRFYNVSDGNVYSRYAFAEAIKKATGVKTRRLQLPLGLVKLAAATMDKLYYFSEKTPLLNLDKVNELTAPDWSCSIERCKAELDFAPAWDLDRGMQDTLEWYRKERWI